MTEQPIFRGSMTGSLMNIRQQGFMPQTIIDVGAALGTFELYSAFPECHHFMLETIAENEPYLAKLCHKLPKADYIMAGAASQSKEMELVVHQELVHSSVSISEVSNQKDPNPASQVRTIKTVTLDDLCQQQQLSPPYLIKVDVDGNEVDVLKGAIKTLQQTEYIIIESSLFIQIHDVIDFMRSQGFVIYDIVDLSWRPMDMALWQVDIAFVKESGQFRQNRNYTHSTGESALYQHLQSYRAALIQQIEDFPDFHASHQLPIRKVNYLAFPDWNQPEESLLRTVNQLLQFVFEQPLGSETALLLYVNDAKNLELADLAISSALMSLVATREDFNPAQEPEVILVSAMDHIQWEHLLPEISHRVSLPTEDQSAIEQIGAETLPTHVITESLVPC
jgi:FkbM family methyltransferase